MAYRLDVRKQEKGTYLIIQKKYWDKGKKQSRTKHHKSLGYLHDLQKQYPDPVAHFKEVISQMNAEENGSKKLALEIDMNEKLQKKHIPDIIWLRCDYENISRVGIGSFFQ